MTSRDQLKEWQALCDKATPGPWEHTGNGQVEDESGEIDFIVWLDADADFIAAARSAVPELIASVLELEEQLEFATASLRQQARSRERG